ncbi:MAG: hypothetical protein ACL93V_01400 [Candidatus Electrothrix sp. YB6]
MALAGGIPNAQGTYDYKKPGFFQNRPLDRPLRYGFETIFVDPKNPNNPSVEERIAKDIAKTKRNPGIDSGKLSRIQGRILETLRFIDPASLKTIDAFRTDIANKENILKRLFIDYLKRTTNFSVDHAKVELNVEEVSDEVFEVTTNLGDLLGLGGEEIHEMIKKPFFGVTGTNLQLLRMQAVGAASGLTPLQVDFIADRIDFTSNIHLQSDFRHEFTRIREIAEVPVLDAGLKVDVDMLLRLRDSDEARILRDWLHDSTKLTDEEVKDLLGGWKQKIGEVLKTKKAKSVRWLASTGIGIAEPISGMVIGGLDQFLGKFLPGMGPIGFIIGDYKRYLDKQSRN